jgi:hypothetical protein
MTLSAVSRAHKILRENDQDCAFSYTVSICAWRRKIEGRKEMETCIAASFTGRLWKFLPPLSYVPCPLFRAINPYSYGPMSPHTSMNMISKPTVIFMEASHPNHALPRTYCWVLNFPCQRGSPYCDLGAES